MIPQSATPPVRDFASAVTRPSCERCGEQQFAPQRSEYVQHRTIRHIWCCDACGHEFETEVDFACEAA